MLLIFNKKTFKNFQLIYIVKAILYKLKNNKNFKLQCI